MTPDRLRRAPGECWCCGRREPLQARGKGEGLCDRCAHRWQRKGWQGPGPGPERVPAAERAAELLAGARQHDTCAWPPPPGAVTARQAAGQHGVSPRTIVRWRKALRELEAAS